ncbi:MAG: 3-deoxy-D-manno-octulosonic acid transferase [Paracoccaceae bacterium]|nr:MAG: 3-deoxy-D-manno-octulosonic acid transferase [Paracoccaceae bacterium]
MASLALPLYLGLTAALSPLAAPYLRRRLARGREDRERWPEKLGQGMAPRPDGRLVWLHAVGLGEVLALRGLIGALSDRLPEAHFLVTSSALSSAQVLARQMPPRTIHQFLPLDLPGPVTRFLDHWRPALSIWAEQDLWPRLVARAAARHVPLALVNARMGDRAFRARKRVRGLYRDLYARFALIDAQDAATAGHLASLGATDVRVSGSLKAAAPPLACDDAELSRLRAVLSGRRVWAAISTHPADEAAAMAAHVALMARDPGAILILVPRLPARSDEVVAAAVAAGLPVARRSAGAMPVPGVYVADSFGETGLWYRLSPVVLVGGGFGVGGHNPWEGARLGAALLHGPDVRNFASDYRAFHAESAARSVTGPAEIIAALDDAEMPAMARRGQALADRGMAALPGLADALAGLAR